MYKVLLVEDEILERESRRESWIWKSGEFCLAADAANGEDAWQILQHEPIDILVTDIKMPFMDGIELSRLVVQHFPQIRIIILSGHTEFELAQQALTIGVGDYIVKPIRTEDLLQALRKAAAYLDHDRQLTQELEDFRKQVVAQKKFKRQLFFENLSIGLIPADTYMAQTAELGLEMDLNQVCCAILVYLDEKSAISDDDYLMLLESHQLVEDFAEKSNIMAFSRHLRESDFFFPNAELQDVKKFLNQLYSELNNLYQQRQILWQPVIALGGIRQGLSGITESFTDARYLLNYQVLFEQTGPLYIDEALPSLQRDFAKELALSDVRLAIDNILKSGGKNEIIQVVDSLIKRLFALNLNSIFFQFICLEIDNSVTRFLSDIGVDPAHLPNRQNDFSSSLLSGRCYNWRNDISVFSSNLCSLLGEVIELRDAKYRTKFVKMIAVAKKYIDDNFADFDISLGKVAAHININSSYFSSLFSQVMGESFIEYLTRVRIEKAKELLKTSTFSTTDIAFRVGYNDSNYFSKIFKKMTQVTPRSFKHGS